MFRYFGKVILKFNRTRLSFIFPFFIFALFLGFFYGCPWRGAQKAQAADTFRVTTYEFEDATFTGSSYTLALNNNLAADYFAMVAGPNDETASRGPDDDGVRITGDPFSNFTTVTSANQIELTRVSSTNDWIGAVTVVECLINCSTSGFQLSEVREVSLAAGTANTLQTVSDTLSQVHTSRTVPFGGRFGGGMDTTITGLSNNDYSVTLGMRIYKSSTNQITYERYGAESRVPQAGTVTTYIVEWGSEWTVQNVNVTGTNVGDGINATGEYNTASISSVTRDNTWVWGVGHSQDDGLGDGAFGQVITLGDGVSQNATETAVAVGAEGAMISPGRDFQVYVMEHSSLAVDYRFKTDGDTGAASDYQELNLTIDGSGGSEVYNNASTSIRYTEGYRIPLHYASSGGTGQAYSRSGGWALRIDSSSNLHYWRAYAGQPHASWTQIVDFAGFSTGSSLKQIRYHWRNDDGSESAATSATAGAEDTDISNLARNQTMRLRLEVSNEGSAVSDTLAYRLEYGVKSSNCGAVSVWTDVGAVGGAWDMSDSSYLTDGNSTTNIAIAVGGVTDENTAFETPNAAVKDTSSQTLGITLSSTEFAEIEYSIQALSGAVAGETYCFRATDAGTALDSYLIYPEASIFAPTADIGEYGTVALTGSSSQQVNLSNTYTNMVVVASARYAPNTGIQRAPRILSKTNGSPSSFILKVDNEAGSLISESTTVDWITMEAGSHSISNGTDTTKVIAGSQSTSAVGCNGSWPAGTQVNFNPTFNGSPSVLHTIASNNDTTWTVSMVNDGSQSGEPTSSNMYVLMNRSFASCTHSAENIDYIAFDTVNGTNNSVEFESVIGVDNVSCCTAGGYATSYSSAFSTAPEVTVISQMGEDGGNGGYAVTHTGTAGTASTHYGSIDEDGPLADRSHTNEYVAVIAFDAASGTISAATSESLSVDIVNAGGTSVASPSVAFGAISFSWNAQQATGVLGVSVEKIRITNATATPIWNTYIAASSGSAALWQGAAYSYDFNDSASVGRLNIDASGGIITPQTGCNSTGLSLGSSTYFQQGVQDTVDLLTAGSSAGINCYWDLTSVNLTQDIPVEQEVDAYSIDMTLTVN